MKCVSSRLELAGRVHLPDALRTAKKGIRSPAAERCRPQELPKYSCKSSVLVDAGRETFGECKEKCIQRGGG